MRRLVACAIAVSAILATPVTAAPRQWVCLDREGNEVVQHEPCAEINTQFRHERVPAYVWGIVAVLGLAWVFVLMPERLLPWRRREPDVPDLGWDAPPLPAPAPQPPQVAKPAPAPAPLPGSSRPTSWTIEGLVRLSPARFDELIQALWQSNGYKAVATGHDVKIHQPGSGNLFAVARRPSVPNEAVSATALEPLWDTVLQNGAGLGICYGLAGFATDALIYVQGKRLKLVSGAELLAQVRTLKPEQQQTLLEHAWRQA
jgi:hypothetical protein